MQALTLKQKKILDYIVEYQKKSGVSPTLAEIAAFFKFSSIGTVQQYIQALRDKGYLTDPGSTKGDTLRQARSLTLSSSTRRRLQDQQTSSLLLPLLGRVAAGQPIDYQFHDRTIEIPAFMKLPSGDHFVLQVEGDSMVEEGIWPDDFVVVHKQSTAVSGQIVVAQINHEALIKKIQIKPTQIELHSANEFRAYAPILVRESDDFRIEGLFCGLLRKGRN